jgi:hypothetical protein
VAQPATRDEGLAVRCVHRMGRGQDIQKKRIAWALARLSRHAGARLVAAFPTEVRVSCSWSSVFLRALSRRGGEIPCADFSLIGNLVTS